MKSHFPGFYPLQSSDLDELIQNSVIVLDADVLFTFFALSESNLEHFFSFIEDSKVKRKLWMPYEIAWYYHQFMNDIILQQREHINSVLANLKRCKDSIESTKHYPYVNTGLLQRLKDVSTDIEVQCNEQRKRLSERLIHCSIKDRIDTLFAKKIGSFYQDAELNTIYLDGKSRASSNIPPYCNERESQNSRLKFHDLIVWKQMQGYAKEKKTNILFVTGRVKQGWYTIVEQKPVSPRQELVNEFYVKTKQRFYCVALSDFVANACRIYNIVMPDLSSLLLQLTAEVENVSFINGSTQSTPVSVTGTNSIS